MNPKPVARFLDVSEQKAVVAYCEPVHKLLRKKTQRDGSGDDRGRDSRIRGCAGQVMVESIDNIAMNIFNV